MTLMYSRWSVRLATLLLGSCLLTPVARATIINGQVTNTMGQGIASVNLDYIDLATGINIPLVNGGTDILGFYSIDVPVGNYDLRYKPVRGDRYPAKVVRSVTVAGASMVIDETLDDAWFVTGRVLDAMGVPLVDADMDLIDSLSGVKLFLANDKTDASGDFLVAVPPGVHDIVVEPPPGTRLVTRVFPMQVLSADLPLGNIGLAEGWLVTGRVTDSGDVPVLDADLDALYPVTGEKLPISHDKTDAAGTFSIVVEAGFWDIDVAPPAGSRLLAQRLLNVEVPPDTDLGTLVLQSGWLVSGRVLDSMGLPVAGVDIDAVDQVSGASFPLSGDTTDAAGMFTVGVPAGTWRFDFEPAGGSRLIARQLLDVGISSDTDLGDVVLSSGFLLSGRVLEGGALPVAGADLDVTDQLTGVKLPLANDVTNALGLFELAVPAGLWQVDVQPPPGTRLQAMSLADTVVLGDEDLGDIVLVNGWVLSGRVVDEVSSPIAAVNLDLVDEVSGVDLPLANDLSAGDGRFAIVAGGGVFTLQLKPFMLGPHGPKEVPGIVLSADLDLGDILLAPGFLLDGRAVDESGQPVEGADIDLNPASPGPSIFLVGDTTAADGRFSVKAPLGLLTLVVTPAAGSGLLPTTVNDVFVDAPTSVGDIVLRDGVLVSGVVEAPAGTPLPGVLVSHVNVAGGFALGPEDTSDAAGAYSLSFTVSSNAALWFEPPAASPWLPRLLSGVRARRDVVLPPVVLERGVVVAGLVTDGGGSPVASTLVSLVSTRDGGLLADIVTGVDGRYSVTVPGGTHDVLADAPVGSGLASAALLAELFDMDRVLPTIVLESAFVVDVRLVDGIVTPVTGVSVRAHVAGGGPELPLPELLSAADGRLSLPLAPGSVDLVFTPPPFSGLGALAETGVVVAGALDLGDLVLPVASAPTVASLNPTAGSTQGGVTVTLTGTAFALGVEASLGGVALERVVRVDASTLTGVTRSRPAGRVDVEVKNPGLPAVILAAGFEYVQADPDLLLRVTKTGPIFTDLLLDWTDDGRASWRVFRSPDPIAFGDADALQTVGVPTYLDRQASGLPGVHYFLVE